MAVEEQMKKKLKWKSEETTADWKKQNLKDIENRLSGWQLQSFLKSYNCKIEEWYVPFKKAMLKK